MRQVPGSRNSSWMTLINVGSVSRHSMSRHYGSHCSPPLPRTNWPTNPVLTHPAPPRPHPVPSRPPPRPALPPPPLVSDGRGGTIYRIESAAAWPFPPFIYASVHGTPPSPHPPPPLSAGLMKGFLQTGTTMVGRGKLSKLAGPNGLAIRRRWLTW